ncbi:uncharacterized protein LOC109847442 [Asparagus officinalis]|uniref:uncharacterized protein LOC109847442 n=1 Tax=Asparagus officinalis TaxID=4686 RepID=UPI00098E3107|nr:uncharacterized protein LOC109847442 [Asparagus officinalis]
MGEEVGESSKVMTSIVQVALHNTKISVVKYDGKINFGLWMSNVQDALNAQKLEETIMVHESSSKYDEVIWDKMNQNACGGLTSLSSPWTAAMSENRGVTDRALETKRFNVTFENAVAKFTKGSLVVMNGVRSRNLYYLKENTEIDQYGLELDQLNVKTTFLYGDLDEKIYMTQSLGFRAVGKEKLVCMLKKSLYGLKQSPRQWYKQFDGFMLGHSFVIDRLKIQLSSEFETKDLGEAMHILGMEIGKDRDNDIICLTQVAYLKKVLQRFNVSMEMKIVSVPLGVHLKF